MNRRRTALALAAIAAPLAVVGSAAPAAAADCSYPPGTTNFRLTAFPSFARVAPGSVIELGGRLERNGGDCGQRRIGIYFRLQNKKSFFLQSRQGTTDSGVWAYRLAPKRDFRYFANYDVNAVTRGARSPINLVQVR